MATTPQDRKPPAKRATVRKPTASELAAADAARVEAEAEALDTDWMTIPLADLGDVRVLPFTDWPRSTYRQIVRAGDFEAVRDVIHDDDLPTWDAWDSTIGELISWVVDIITDAGQDLGESKASKPSSRVTRRR